MQKNLNLRAALVMTAVCLSIAAHAVADPAKRFDIPPGDLATALDALARQSGVELMYSSSQVKGLHTSGVQGEYTAESAANQLLSGTRLQLRIHESGALLIAEADPRTSSVRARERSANIRLANLQLPQSSAGGGGGAADNPSDEDALPDVVVTVYGRGLQESVREVPQTIDVFQHEFLETVNAKILEDVVRFVPNAAPFQFFGPDPLYSVIRIRGFDSTPTWNGLGFRFAMSPPNMAAVERIEVLKGPASVLYGSMEPGAVLNIVTKRPQSEFHAQTDLRVGSYNEVAVSGDIGGPLSDGIRARLNAAYSTTDTVLDHGGVRDVFVAPVVEFDLGERTQLILDGFHEKRSYPNGYFAGYVPRSTVPGLGNDNPFGTLPISANTAYDIGLSEERKVLDANARLSHEFAEHDLSLNVTLSYNKQDREELGVGGNFGGLTDDREFPRTFYILGGDPDETKLLHVDLGGAFATGAINHKVTLGVDYRRVESPFGKSYYDFAAAPNDLFEPVYGNLVVPAVIPFDTFSSTETTKGYFIQDRMSYGKAHLLLGGRFSDHQTDSTFTPFGGDTSFDTLDDDVWTPQIGFLYEVTDKVALFASRAESFVPRSAYSESQQRVLITPETSVQYEAGVKIALSRRISANAAVFQIEKNDIFSPHPTDPFDVVPVGQVKSEGVELSIDGELAPGLTVYAGYGYNKTEITEAASFQGRPFINIPEQTFALVSRYELGEGALRGLGVSGSLQYTGDSWSFGYLVKNPSWVRLNLGLSYPVSEQIDVSLNVNNVLDEGLYAINGYQDAIVNRQERTYFGIVNLRF